MSAAPLIGLTALDPETAPEAHAALTAVARRLRLSGKQVIGFVPANRDVAVPAALVQLSLMVADLGGRPVTLVDANARFPAFALSTEPDTVDAAGLSRVALAPNVTLRTPGRPRVKAFTEEELAGIVAREREASDLVLVDLTGLEADGELLLGFDLVDAVALVAHAGRTREYDLTLVARQIPPDKIFGVLLVG